MDHLVTPILVERQQLHILPLAPRTTRTQGRPGFLIQLLPWKVRFPQESLEGLFLLKSWLFGSEVNTPIPLFLSVYMSLCPESSL